MIRYLDLFELIDIAAEVTESTPATIFKISKLEILSAAAHAPQASFDGTDLYPSIQEKAAVLGFQIARNHPLLDGNKLLAISATIQFLMVNDYQLEFDVDDAEQIVLKLAAGELTKDEYSTWIQAHITPWEFIEESL